MENGVTKEVCQERNGRVQDELKRIGHRITNVEERQDKVEDTIARIASVNERMGAILENDHAKIERHDKNIDELRKKPGKHWETLLAAIITATIATLVTFIGTKIFG